MRAEMGENYRTLLGHFRHELGHYYWDRLVRDDAGRLRAIPLAVRRRKRRTTKKALRRHYAEGAPADWETRHISAYAASHPWEDWAETFAHYLHITDTLEMVHALDLPLGRLDTDAETTICRPAILASRLPAARRPKPQRGGAVRPDAGALAGALRSLQLDQQVHGPAGPLPVRDLAGDGRKAGLRARTSH